MSGFGFHRPHLGLALRGRGHANPGQRRQCRHVAAGQILWKTFTKPIPAHSMGQPIVLHPDADGKPVTCIFTTWGQLIRLFDGKLLLDKMAQRGK